MPMTDELMLQALESTADQFDRLAEIIDEFLTMGEAGVPMSATTRQKYAAEMAELRGHRAHLRKTIVKWSRRITAWHCQVNVLRGTTSGWPLVEPVT